MTEDSPRCEISWLKPLGWYWYQQYGIKVKTKYLVLVTIDGEVVAIYQSNRRRYIGDKLWPKD